MNEERQYVHFTHRVAYEGVDYMYCMYMKCDYSEQLTSAKIEPEAHNMYVHTCTCTNVHRFC